MRLSKITIVGFGGVADRIEVDLDADVIIIAGANGFGKTTICNAISWAITGDHASGDGVRNVYSATGSTFVELVLKEGDQRVTVARSLSNPNETNPKKYIWGLAVTVNGETSKGAAAEQWMKANLAQVDPNSEFSSAASVMVEGLYLKQESLRRFLTDQADTERFTAVAEMVGAGRLRSFVTQLESSKTAWVKAVNRMDAELEPRRARIEEVKFAQEALEKEIAHAEAPEVLDRWQRWILELERIGVRFDAGNGSVTEITEETLGKLRSQFASKRSEIEHRESLLLALEAELRIEGPSAPLPSEIDAISQRVEGLVRDEVDLRATVEVLRADSEMRADEFRRNQSAREDLAAMANILLRHVSDNCPACGQGVEPRSFTDRLHEIVAASVHSIELEQVNEARARLEAEESSLLELSRLGTRLKDKLRVAEEQQASVLTMQRRRRDRILELGPLGGESLDAVRDDALSSVALQQIGAELELLRRRRAAITDAEQLTMTFESTASAQGARKRLQRMKIELSQAESELSRYESEVTKRRGVADDADRLVRQLKLDAEGFVTRRLESLNPLLAQFYSAIDPHPTFRSIQILTHQAYGKHRLAPVLHDPELGVSVNDPGGTLSTSQANALAVALFLSFNMGFASSALHTLILDDPLQNLDDVHLLGLVDLLRKVAPSRQIVITTHDQAFAALLARKLRPIGSAARTVVVRFFKWDRSGPGFDQVEIPREEQPLKLTAV